MSELGGGAQERTCPEYSRKPVFPGFLPLAEAVCVPGVCTFAKWGRQSWTVLAIACTTPKT